MEILLTNDDGIHASGLRTLYAALRAAGHNVHVVAPLAEQSAVGHAVTLATPLQVKEIRENGFQGQAVTGFPADCVKLGAAMLLSTPPDIVISGINSGANVGVDIIYSGTVSAATEGALMGFRSLAVSVDTFGQIDLTEQSAYTAALLDRLDWNALPPRCVLNLNFPDRPMSATLDLRVCPQTTATYRDRYDRRVNERGRVYYWLNGEIPPESVAPDTDRALLTQGHITLTTLKFDFTDHDGLARLARALRG